MTIHSVSSVCSENTDALGQAERSQANPSLILLKSVEHALLFAEFCTSFYD